LSGREAVKVFNITRATAAKWCKRDDVLDRSHRAHTLHMTLNACREAIVLSLRQTLYLPKTNTGAITLPRNRSCSVLRTLTIAR